MTDDAGAGGEASRPLDWCLAYGVVVHATDAGLVVEGQKRHRVRLHDGRLERALVEALAGRQRLHDVARAFGDALSRAMEQLRGLGAVVPMREQIVVVDRLGVDVQFRARSVIRAETAHAIVAADLAVIVGERTDDVISECLARGSSLGLRTLLVWTDRGDVVAVFDDPASAPCARCALSFDTHAPAISAGFAAEKYASAASEHVSVERALAAAVTLHVTASEVPLEPGHALVWSLARGGPTVHRFPQHPACECRARTGKKADPVPRLEWDELAAARFAPIVPLSVNGLTARAAYRGAREPWPLSQDTFGIAIAVGPSGRERALSEAAERFAMLHAPCALSSRPRRELDEPVLSDGAIDSLLFRDEERAAAGFRFPPFDGDVPLDWSWAVRASSGERLLVPTSLVGRPAKGGARLVDATSNGYACHPSEREAKLRALLEIVERDALLLRWYTDQELVRVDGADVPPGTVVMLGTVDIDLPVVAAAVCLSDGSLRIGSAAALTFDVALDRAVRELDGQLSGATVPGTGEVQRVDRGYGPRDHLAYYKGDRGRAVFDRWSATSKDVSARELRDRWPHVEPSAGLDRAIETVARAGLDILFVDRSLPELFGSWHIARALVPGCIEISWGMPYRRLASPRITRALASGARLSSCPHPYA